MHLKRYRSETVKDALRAVREELGPNALVLSTRTVTATGMRGLLGKREVEITAAAERHEMPEERHRLRLRLRRGRPPRSPPCKGAKACWPSGRRAKSRRDSRPAASRPASRRRSRRSIQLIGVAARIWRASGRRWPPSLRRWPRGDEPYAPVEVFVGPPGVGKTTTIAKIAAQERARQGQRLGLLAADGFRVGAIEQLRLYADILGSPFGAARTPDEFLRAIDEVKRPLLVDTAGRSPADDISKDMFRVLASRRDVRTHLVIPATTSGEDGRAPVRSLRGCASLARGAHASGRGRVDRIARQRAARAPAAALVFRHRPERARRSAARDVAGAGRLDHG